MFKKQLFIRIGLTLPLLCFIFYTSSFAQSPNPGCGNRCATGNPTFQPYQDCPGAIEVCNLINVMPANQICGPGRIPCEIPFNAHEPIEERNTVWYKFTIASEGRLAFKIRPLDHVNGSQGNSNYDWTLLSLQNYIHPNQLGNRTFCELISDSRTSFFWGANNSNLPGVTGMFDTARIRTGPASHPSLVRNPKFVNPTPVRVGQTFVLAIDYPSGQNPAGFILEFVRGGLTLTNEHGSPYQTASVIPTASPKILSVENTEFCDNSKLTVKFDNDVVCGSLSAQNIIIKAKRAGTNILIPALSSNVQNINVNGLTCRQGFDYFREISINTTKSLTSSEDIEYWLVINQSIPGRCGLQTNNDSTKFTIRKERLFNLRYGHPSHECGRQLFSASVIDLPRDQTRRKLVVKVQRNNGEFTLLGAEPSDVYRYHSGHPTNVAITASALGNLTPTNGIRIRAIATYQPDCIDSSELFFNPAPLNLSAIDAPDTVCIGQTFSASYAGFANSSYRWSFPQGFGPNHQNTGTINLTPNTTGRFRLAVQEASNTCVGDPIEKFITVLGQPTVPDVASFIRVCPSVAPNISVGSSVADPNLLYRWEPAYLFTNPDASSTLIQNNTVVGFNITATLKVTDRRTGCSATRSFTVSPNLQPPAPIISLQNNGLCGNGAAILRVNQEPNTVYIWSNGATGNTITVNEAGFYTVRATREGCESEQSPAFEVTRSFLSGNIFGKSLICTPNSLVVYRLENTGSVQPNRYNWFVENGTIIGSAIQASVSINWNQNFQRNGKVKLVIRNSTGCTSDTLIYPVMLTQTGQLPKPLGDSVLCGVRRSLYRNNLGLDYLITWSVTNGRILNGQGSNTVQVEWDDLPAGSTGTISYTATSVNVNSCSGDSEPLVVRLNGNVPPLTISGRTSYCNDEVIELVLPNNLTTALNVVIPAGVEALPNNGGPSNILRYRASRVGSYQFIVTSPAHSSCNGADRAFRTVTVNPSLAPVTLRNASICKDNQVELDIDNRNGGNVRFSWEPSTGLSNPNIARPIFSMNTPGEYRYRVTMTSDFCSRTDEIVINVQPEITQPAARHSKTICGAGSIAMLKVAPKNGSTYNWQIPASLPILGPRNKSEIMFFAPPAGTYTYSVQEVTAEGCASSMLTDTVTIIEGESVPSFRNATICAGSIQTLDGGTVSANTTYRWEPENLFVNATQPQGQLRASSIGSFSVRLVTKNEASACEQVTFFRLNAQAVPDAAGAITASSSEFCKWDVITLTAPQHSGGGYLWSNGETTPSITVREAGNYTVRLSNSAGCLGEPSPVFATTYRPAPAIPQITPLSETTNCYGGAFKLTAPEANGYLWSNGQTTREIIVRSADPITLQVRGGNNCLSDPSPAIALTYEAPKAPEVTENILLCPEAFENIPYSIAKVEEGMTYNWVADGGTVIKAEGQQAIVTWFPNAITRELKVTKIYPEERCGPATAAYNIQVAAHIRDANCDVNNYPPVVPNVVTPNGDGFNDRLQVKNLQYYDNASLELYDRFGKKLMDLKADGDSFPTESLRPGMYYYKLSASVAKPAVGWLEVIR